MLAGLRSVVWFVTERRLEVVVDDEANRVRRKITVTWHAREEFGAIPANWENMVFGELEFQRGEAQRRRVESLFGR